MVLLMHKSTAAMGILPKESLWVFGKNAPGEDLLGRAPVPLGRVKTKILHT